jgi:hypothetical protein
MSYMMHDISQGAVAWACLGETVIKLGWMISCMYITGFSLVLIVIIS